MWLSNWHSRCLHSLQWCTVTWKHELQGTLCHSSRTGNPDTLSLCVGVLLPSQPFHRGPALDLNTSEIRSLPAKTERTQTFKQYHPLILWGSSHYYFCAHLFSLSLYSPLVLHWTENGNSYFVFQLFFQYYIPSFTQRGWRPLLTPAQSFLTQSSIAFCWTSDVDYFQGIWCNVKPVPNQLLLVRILLSFPHPRSETWGTVSYHKDF